MSPGSAGNPLTDDKLSPFFQDADTAAIRAQNKHLASTRWQLIGLVVAAVAGAATLSTGPWFTVTASLSATGFAAAFILKLIAELERDETRWYQARAAAESAKTLAWRFAVCGLPYPKPMPRVEAENSYVDRLGEISRALKFLDVAALSADRGSEITQAMAELRQSSLTERRSTYVTFRICAQAEWYERKARWNQKCARVWLVAILVVEVLGITAGILRITGWLSVDLLGILAAISAGLAAWAATKQFRNLAAAYSLTGRELRILASKVPNILNESQWANLVDQSEEAISREHTMWLASRVGV